MADDTDIIPRRLSSSQIRVLQTCPRQYCLKYVMQLKDANADAEYFIIGRAFDDILHGTPVELVDLRPLDESKKDYRAMLKGMRMAVMAKIDVTKLVAPEQAIRTETETMKVDGLYVDEDDWWLVEVKTAGQSDFVLEEKIAMLKNDAQIAGYFARVPEIADAFFLDVSKFRGCKYIWALKPSKKKDPEYIAHVVDLTSSQLGDPTTTWRTAKAYGKLIADVIRTTYLQRRDPTDVPCNPAACRTPFGDCGFWEVCYGRRVAPAAGEEVCT